MKCRIIFLFFALAALINVEAAVLVKLINCSESQAEYQIFGNGEPFQLNRIARGESREFSLAADFTKLNARSNQELSVSYWLNKQQVTSVVIPAHHKMCSHTHGVTKKCYDFDYTSYEHEPLSLYLCKIK